MKIAAYQAPLAAGAPTDVIELVRQRVAWCERAGVEILCCPEAVLGGLADDAACPADIAIDVASGQLDATLAPLASETVTTIVGFTEVAAGRFYNSAALLHRGSVVGVYRKLYPAIRTSIYHAGDRMPVFTINGLTFGIVICNDSNYAKPARAMTAQGATVLFVPSNNSLRSEVADVVAESRNADIARATENNILVVRADVAGRMADRVSFGSSAIVAPDGTVLRSARLMTEDLLIAEIDPPSCRWVSTLRQKGAAWLRT